MVGWGRRKEKGVVKGFQKCALGKICRGAELSG